MYYHLVKQCTQSLKNLEVCLDKAEQFAQSKTFDVGVLMNGRLAPDMKDFIYQVQSACDYVKGAAAWLSGQTPPRHEDNEKTIGELRDRIRKTVALPKVSRKPNTPPRPSAALQCHGCPVRFSPDRTMPSR